MAVYFMANTKIRDREEYKKYEDGFDDIFAAYKGKVIAVDDGPVVLEGEWPYTRAVVIRFPGEEEFRSWYESAKYQGLARRRFRASEGDVILIRGRE